MVSLAALAQPIIQHIPFMSIRYEDGGSLHNPPLYLPLQLFVHHHHLIGTQLGHISHCDGVHLQLVLEHLSRSIDGGGGGGGGGGKWVSSPRHH